MKSIKIPAVLIILSIFMMGCPYSSSVPLDSPSIKIDPMILGAWKGDMDSKCTYMVLKGNEFTYKIEERKDSGKINILYAHLTIIDNIKYLNVLDSSNMEKPYCFYKFEKLSNEQKILLTPVTEYIKETFSSSKELNKYFRNNQSNSYFFENSPNIMIPCN